jgi:hypothetical protein
MSKQKCKYTVKRLFGEAMLHGIKQQMNRGMNMQKCKYTKKRLFSEAMLHKMAEAHTCTGVVVLTQISPYTRAVVCQRGCVSGMKQKSIPVNQQ